jgi:hypothetical protein
MDDYVCPYQSSHWYYIFLGVPEEYKKFEEHISNEKNKKLNKISKQMDYEKLFYCFKKKQIKIIL